MAGSLNLKKHTEYIAISLLLIVAFFIGINKLKKQDSSGGVVEQDSFNKKWEEVRILETSLPKEDRDITYGTEAGRDPFKSPYEDKALASAVPTIGAEETAELPQLMFQGMIWNSQRPQAIINNKVYEVNDEIDADPNALGGSKIKIRGITKNGIYLRYQGKDFIVRPK